MVNLTDATIAGIIVIVIIIIVGVYLAIRLIRRSKSGREIRQFKELVQHFIESDDIPVFLKDERLRYLFVNPPMQEIFGEESASIVGKSDFDLMDVEKAQQQWNS
ncbi:MAG: diguanylate cyclase, partial [Eubacteriaceae bacterium]|nr:diguanylate cyclase [Eubacteriaceae bacterium]